ncbi:MAG: hypothetical protein ABI611_11010 [Solirubrobacteraceae bacterium]
MSCSPAAGGHPPRHGPHRRGRPLRGPHGPPGAYTIPLDGPTGALCAAAGWSPWRPAHIHLIVSADGHEPLVTQLFIDSSEHLDNDVASATKRELIVHPEPATGEDGLAFSYDLALTRVRTASPVAH